MKKISFIKTCLVISLLFNLGGFGLGLVYLHYVDLSIPYAISRAPHIMRSVLGITPAEDITLKQIITQEYPQLETKDITDYERISILRDWAAKVIDVSTYSLMLDVRDRNFGSWSAHDMYSAFVSDSGGVACGGAATFLVKVFNLFGFEAYTLNFGIMSPYTHMVTLVLIEHGGQELLSVQDAFYNLTYEDLKGKPMGYFTMLRLLKQQKDDEIVTIEPESPLVRDHLIYDGDPWTERKDCIYVGPVQQDELEINGVTKLRCEVASPSLTDEMEEFWTERGLPPKYVYLYLFPRSISYGSRAKQLLEEASQITRWPLPVK